MTAFDLFKIIIFGAIEGITEWLPVSSTGHLKLADKFFSLPFSSAFCDLFEYVIQLFAVFAVVITYFRKLFPFTKKQTAKNRFLPFGFGVKKEVLNTWLKISVACVPALTYLLLDPLFAFDSPILESTVIATTLILYGVLFILSETFISVKPKTYSVAELSPKTAFLIGCFQVLAVIPGTSRSGVTILGALLLGVSKETATEFSFFLALPAMIGMSAYKILKYSLEYGMMETTQLFYLLAGGAVAFTVSFFSVKFLTEYVKKHGFKAFGIYRILLGLAVFTVLVFPQL